MEPVLQLPAAVALHVHPAAGWALQLAYLLLQMCLWGQVGLNNRPPRKSCLTAMGLHFKFRQPLHSTRTTSSDKDKSLLSSCTRPKMVHCRSSLTHMVVNVYDCSCWAAAMLPFCAAILAAKTINECPLLSTATKQQGLLHRCQRPCSSKAEQLAVEIATAWCT